MSRLTIGTAGIAAVILAGTFGTPGWVQAQESEAEIEEIVVTGIGSRGNQRSAVDLAVPVDVLSLEELNNTNQIDIGQALHFLSASVVGTIKYSAPETST